MLIYCSNCGHGSNYGAKFCFKCGVKLAKALQIGSKLDRGRYEVLRPLKTGGMGTVYLLRDNRLERECVLKEMLPPSSDPSDIKEFRECFRNEALTLSKLSHPNLPPVHDHFDENNLCYLVMEYIEGDDLESLLSKSAPKGFPEECVGQWTLTICSILEYLHSQSPVILYRDLKPSNIMIRKRDERLFLIDFGIAKSVNKALTHKTSWGTEGYAPIEQMQGEPEVRSDLYALGATMHHLLTGRVPLPLKFPAVRTFRPDLSQNIESFLEKALKIQALDRFQSARDMREALERLLTSAKIVDVGKRSVHSLTKVVQINVLPTADPVKSAQTAAGPTPLPALLPTKMNNPKDGSEMILIPEGEFLMGSLKSVGNENEHPQHVIWLDAFYISKYQVTNRQFAQFAKETGYKAKRGWDLMSIVDTKTKPPFLAQRISS